MSRRDHARTFALIALVLLTFGRVATHEFVNIDDDKFIAANPSFLPPTFASLADGWRHPHARLYVPVTMSAWWLVAQAGVIRDVNGGYALNPWVFHAACLSVHLVNVLLVRRLLRAITRDDLAAVVGAAVFAVHPFQAETVAWASELKDLLAAMFGLLAIEAAIRATTAEDANRDADAGANRDARPDAGRDADAKRRWWWWGGAIGCFGLALLSKPSAVTLPLIAATVLWLLDVRPRTIAIVCVAGLVLAAPLMLATRVAQPALELPWPPLWQRPLVAADAVAFYLRKLIWPLGMAIDYGRRPAAIVASGAIRWTWVFPAAVTMLVLLSRRKTLVAAWAIFLAGPSANLGLLPFDFQYFSTVADHYVYFGLLGAAVAVAWAVQQKATSIRVCVPVIVLLAALSFVQAGRWRDSLTLWRHGVAVNSASGLSHINLGVALIADRKPAEAIPVLERAAALEPNEPYVYLNLVYASLAVGDTARAATAAEALAGASGQFKNVDDALIAAVLEKVAQMVAARGDEESARRLREAGARWSSGQSSRRKP